uniref:VWFA domain-containing protein n=1 Tax=mine drainage metagenome TaxID=410659 RepID=E6PM67_9ZZZZ
MTLWPSALQWARPWAWLFAAAPLLLWALRRWAGGRMRQDAGAYADAQLHPWAVRLTSPGASSCRRVGELLLGLLLAASLAGPRLPLARSPAGLQSMRHAVNIMVVLDASPGMEQANAQGLSLMEHARIELQDLLPLLRGERLGLAIYGRGAGVLLPCTDDMAIFGHVLQQASPTLLQAQHSAGLHGALELARRELLATPGSSRAVLLVAGADPSSPVSQDFREQMQQSAASLRAAGIPVFVLLLEHASWFGASASPLDSGVLDELARATDGASSKLGSDPWGALYTRGLARLPSNPVPAGEIIAWRELDGVPLLGALLLMLLLSIPWTSPAEPASQSGKQSAGRFCGVLQLWSNAWRRGKTKPPAALVVLAALGMSFLLLSPPLVHAQTTTLHATQAWDAWTAWRAGNFKQARRLYAALPGFDARMGEGGSAYRLGAYPQALAAYRRAMLDANTNAQRAQALYNLGNAAFHLPGGLREALDAYDASLALAPGNPAALRNMHLAEAQWTFEHPETALTAMRKRGAPQPQSFFGRGSKRPPSQMGHERQQPGRAAVENQALQTGGSLQGASITPAASNTPPAKLTQEERQAAQRKMELLDDDAPQLLADVLEHDNKVAIKGLRAQP